MRNTEVLKERAENMRKNPTLHEKKFKDRLEMAGIFYKCQWIFGNCIVDFLIGKTIVEIDGYSHFEADQAAYDKQRTSYLNGLGYAVIRVRNEHVVSFDMNKLKSKHKTKDKDKVQQRVASSREYWNKKDKELKKRREQAKNDPHYKAPGKTQSEIKEILKRRSQQQDDYKPVEKKEYILELPTASPKIKEAKKLDKKMKGVSGGWVSPFAPIVFNKKAG